MRLQLVKVVGLALASLAAASAGSTQNGTDKSDKHHPHFSFDKLFSLQKNLWDNFLTPKDAVQAKSINSTLFADNVQGRVDVTRTFDGRELNTEYLFGLFANIQANAQQFTLLGYPVSYEIVHFAGSQNIAAANTRVMFSVPVLKGATIPIEIDTWFSFNEKGQIQEYDASFRWWDWAFDNLLGAFSKANKLTLDQTVATATQALAGSICGTAANYCNGTNVQYNGTADCTDFLTKQVPFGKPYQLGQNTLLCRMVHQNMVPYRPEVHCPHIGKSGGGYCVDDLTYEGVVGQDYFTNSPFVFAPKGKSVSGSSSGS